MIPTTHIVRAWLFSLLLVVVFITGCQTAPPAGNGPAVRDGQVMEFVPMQPAATMQLAEGRYPTLFSGASTAIWTGYESDVATPDQANALGLSRADFVVIRCNLESAFADMSIAYDAVGLRGIQAYLLTPDKRQVFPVQVIQDGALGEEKRGALRVFRRTNMLVFPKKDVYMVVSRESGPVQPLRLMLDGCGSSFYFEWRSGSPAVTEPLPLSQQPVVKTMKKGIKNTGKSIADFSHTVD